jgi:ubiquinone/menaquinone biosynthesis C-methylase UbiE
MAKPIYDRIGARYRGGRREEPRIAAALERALGDAASVVNVGAGTGSYEPDDRHVAAVEPSPVMAAQRRADAAPCVRGAAEALPFADGAFAAAMAVLTLHHWTDKGLVAQPR